MPGQDAAAMTSYLESYLDHIFPEPTPTKKPTCIPVKDEDAIDYVCDCSLGSKTAHFPITKKTIKTTLSGTKTQKVELCDYSTWPKPQTSDTPKTSDPPYSVPTDQSVVPNVMTCNNPKTGGTYGVQTIASYAMGFYSEVSASGLSAKPTGSSVEYSGGWNGFKILKTKFLATGDLPGDKSGSVPSRRWLALSIQYLNSACGSGENEEIGFADDKISLEDFLSAFVERSIDCKLITSFCNLRKTVDVDERDTDHLYRRQN